MVDSNNMSQSLVFPDLNFDSFFTFTPNQAPKLKEVTSPLHLSRWGKTVSFSERVKVLEIPSARQLSRKEKQALWHEEPCEDTDSTGTAHKGSVMRQLLCVIADNRDDSDEQDDEDEDDQGFYHSEEKEKLPVTAVLMEQKSQRESGIEDAYFIAKVYKQCSAHSTMKAQIKAMQDEQEARDYYNISKDSGGRRRSKRIFSRIIVR